MIEELCASVAFIFGLMVVGAWLERINGKDGFWDEFFTPFGMGATGIGYLVLVERSLA
jgi:hypothetical protein